MYKKWLDTLLDLLFPEKQPCVFCWRETEGKSSAGLCIECAARILAWSAKLPFCARCGRFTVQEKCPNCFDWSDELHSVASVVPYDGIFKEKIFDLKFNNKSELAFPLGYLMAAKASNVAYGKGEHGRRLLAIPIPLHQIRHEERGYNQSAILAKVIVQQMNIGYAEDVLKRCHYENRQIMLGRHARKENMKSAFTIENTNKIIGRSILLIDDVITTGATMQAAAKVLIENGAASIYGLTWAAGFDLDILDLKMQEEFVDFTK